MTSCNECLDLSIDAVYILKKLQEITDMYMLDYKYIIKQLVKILIEKGIYLYNDDYDVTNPIEYYLFKYYVKNTDYFNHNINEYNFYK